MAAKRNNHESGSNKLVTNLIFLFLVTLLVLSLLISLGLGLFTLWKHQSAMEHTTDSSSSANNNLINQLVVSNNNNQQQQIRRQEVAVSADGVAVPAVNLPEGSIVPYFPPFAPIPDGEQKAKETLAGQPSIAGIVQILKIFLQELRASNKNLQNVSNDQAGQDKVRHAYFELVRKHLVPFDRAYKGKTIFPIREDEDSIYISLAAFREHLLYDTLAGAYGEAVHPEKIFVGIVMQNCFGKDDQTGEEYGCRTGAQVVGKDKNGHDMTKVSDAPPDPNGVEKFCNDAKFKKYCLAGQLRVLSVHESESLGPAAARYYASKLWGGETFFLQADAHLQFTPGWDQHYINEVKATKNYPKSILSMYPPGFGHIADETPGTRLCTCTFSENGVEDHIIRINNGASYKSNVEYPRPTQIAFIAAGFFFGRAEFLTDVPFDPFLPWCFMGEEIALSMRAWTAGWNIYAPRKNWIAHQYRPGRMGLPKFWGSVGRTFKRGIGFSNRLQAEVVNRIKHMVGYPEASKEKLEAQNLGDVLEDIDYYGMGKARPRSEYIQLTGMDFDNHQCKPMKWCNQGELE